MNNKGFLKFLFWANIAFLGMNLFQFLVLGSIFSGLVCMINAYAAYTMKDYV